MENESVDRLILGWNVGGTTCSAVVGTPTGKVLEKRSWPSDPSRGPQAMMGEFLGQAAPLLEGFPQLGAVGVSVGGPLDPKAGIIYSAPHLPGWKDLHLRDILAEALELPVRAEHDAVARLKAEWLCGAAKRVAHGV